MIFQRIKNIFKLKSCECRACVSNRERSGGYQPCYRAHPSIQLAYYESLKRKRVCDCCCCKGKKMRNFPINLLATTQTVIGKQEYRLRKSVSRVRNDAGYFVSSFGKPICMSGSVQPVKASQYKSMGLDFKKAYIKIYDTKLIEIISRDRNSDQIIWDGYLWHVAEDTSWFLSGGWNYVMCVRLERYTRMTDNQMMIALILEIERQLNLVGITDFEVGRNQQPTNQYTGGDEDDPIKTRVFLYAITKGSDGHGRSLHHRKRIH